MNLLKDVLLGGLSFLGLPQNRAVILMYHSVSPDTDYFMNVEPKNFEKQMMFLASSKREVISLSELVRRLTMKERLGSSVVITFDDGYRDNYEIAFPILKKYGFPATIFVTTGLIGKSDKRNLARLTAEQLQEMESSGFIDIEPHTVSHPKLATVPIMDARKEIEDSKSTIEHLLQKKVSHFAYPYGNYSSETEKIVDTCRFESAMSVKEGTVSLVSELLHLPRVSIDSSTTFAQFKGKVSRAIDVYQSMKIFGN
jgi:peptidoglycan/xylan/chitin deacetylase (PgdA/CDA1 family)